MYIMKDSEIEWIGKIPINWDVRRNKYNFTLNKTLVGNSYSTTQLLSLTKNGVKAITEDDQKGKVPTSFSTYQTVDKDDIVMCLFDLDVSAVFSGISHYEGMISPAYKCFKCNDDIFPQYIDYYFRTIFIDRKYKRYSKNVRYSISADEFMALPILVPPLDTQKSIANFLDQKCSEIDSLSIDIQSQIDILEEYKKSVITEAVTKGLNSDVEIKDSGIEWIGIIPKHWKTPKLKYVAKFYNGDRSSNYPSGNDMVDEGIIFISSNNIHNIEMDNSPEVNKYITEQKYKSLSGAKVNKNDIIFCLRGSVGICSINTTEENGALASSLVDIRTVNGDARFINYFLHSAISEIQTRNFTNGSCAANLSAENVSNYYFLQPPTKEQKEIADYLDGKCAEINAVIADKKSQLETLAEYKKSLIYEYITGKKEVE